MPWVASVPTILTQRLLINTCKSTTQSLYELTTRIGSGFCSLQLLLPLPRSNYPIQTNLCVCVCFCAPMQPINLSLLQNNHLSIIVGGSTAETHQTIWFTEMLSDWAPDYRMEAKFLQRTKQKHNRYTKKRTTNIHFSCTMKLILNCCSAIPELSDTGSPTNE